MKHKLWIQKSASYWLPWQLKGSRLVQLWATLIFPTVNTTGVRVWLMFQPSNYELQWNPYIADTIGEVCVCHYSGLAVAEGFYKYYMTEILSYQVYFSFNRLKLWVHGADCFLLLLMHVGQWLNYCGR